MNRAGVEKRRADRLKAAILAKADAWDAEVKEREESSHFPWQMARANQLADCAAELRELVGGG